MFKKRKKKAVIIFIIILVAAILGTYVLQLTTVVSYAGTPEPKPPMTLEITSYPANLEVGDRGYITCELLNGPEGIYVDWSSDNPAVAVVDPTGSIVAIAPGDAEISVQAVAGDVVLRRSAYVHVNDYKASKITISAPGIDGQVDARGRTVYRIKVGDVLHLTTRIQPEGAKLARIEWTAGNPEIVDLSGGGDVVATAKGETSITVSSGVLSDTILFEIEENGIPVETILRYIILVVVVIIIIVVIVNIALYTAKRRKEEERKRAAAAKHRREEARQRAEEEAKRAADEAKATKIEKGKPVQEPETQASRSAKVSGATVSAAGDAAGPHDENTERALTLDDIK